MERNHSENRKGKRGGGIVKKLRAQSGETLIETLCALLIVVVVMLCLSTSIVSAARVNAQVKDRDVSFRTEDMAYSKSLTVTIQGGNVSATYAVGEYVGSGNNNTASYHYYGALPKNGGN